MSTNKEITQEVRSLLTALSLRDQVEILANVITLMGVSHLKGVPDQITPTNIAEVVLKDRKRNGETIANALATQGLTMLLWLEKQ